MKRIICATAAVIALAAAPAFAQGNSPIPSVAKMARGVMGGMTMGSKATEKLQFGKEESSDLMSSKLVGATVYDNSNNKIGEVEDLQIASGKSIAGVVVSVGGFLGMGERYVLVEPSSFAVTDDNGTIKAYLQATKDELKNAPKFQYTKKS